jgi:hypothetical protein
MKDTKVVITANTENQLRTKTWPEICKWHRLLINSHWFESTATSLYAASKRHEKTWRADAIPWSDTNTEAFAGLHNQGKRLLLIFDEASSIDDKVWEVAEGALTDANTEIIWCVFGNPTRNVGRFKDCFTRLSHRWYHQKVDSRTVDGVAKAQVQAWLEDYGEDSDFFRVRVRGEFPRSGTMQFISSEVVEQARKREPVPLLTDPVIIGVDVARFGDDDSVLCVRRGPWLMAVRSYNGVDTMALAGIVSAAMVEFSASAVFVDETGVGGGVIDRLRQLGHFVTGVNNGSRADGMIGQETASNKGTEMWCRMREWLKYGSLPKDDEELSQQLVGREFGYNVRNEITLEKKGDMKRRGLPSPDKADALSLTFAYPVAAMDQRPRGDMAGRCVTEYDPFAKERM